jgi:hypothetical protein
VLHAAVGRSYDHSPAFVCVGLAKDIPFACHWFQKIRLRTHLHYSALGFQYCLKRRAY